MKHYKLTARNDKDIVYATVAAENLDKAAAKFNKCFFDVTKNTIKKTIKISDKKSEVIIVRAKNIWSINLAEFKNLKGVANFKHGVYVL